MNGLRLSVVAAVLLLSAAAPGCRLFHKRAGQPNPPPSPKPEVTATLPAPEPRGSAAPASSVPPPPELSAQQPDLHQGMPLPARRVPPRPRVSRRSARAPATEPAATPEAATVPAAAAPAPVPQLEQILTPQQQQSYNEYIDRNIVRAQKTVDQLNGRRLTGEQTIYLDRIRAYIQQATDARKSDLFRARDLAERASVLAEDLLKSVQ